jgi:autotransporter-associated beta strand protein
LDVQQGTVEINQTTPMALKNRDYNTAEQATLRFVCAPLGSAATQLAGVQWVTGDGTFEVASGFLKVQSSLSKVNMAMSEKGQVIVRDGALMSNAYDVLNRYANNKAKLVVEGTGLFELHADSASFGALQGDGIVTSDLYARTLTITGDSDGTFPGLLTEKNAATKLSVLKAGPGTQILSGTNTYTGTTTIMGGRLTLEGGNNRLSVNTQVIVTNGVLNLGLTHQTLNNNPDFRAESTLAVEVSKTEIGRLTLTNSVDVSSWKMTINNPSVYPKGKRFAVISTGTEQSITGAPTLVDMPSGFIIYNRDNTIYVDSPAMIIFFK